MQEQIYDMLLKENEVTWQDVIYNLVKTEQMDPWNLDLTKLTNKYISTVREMQEMNYHISGKVLLASAVLLRIKSKRLVEEDINNFDSFLFHSEEEEMYEELDEFLPFHEHKVEIPKLGVRTPQARKRKVSVNDLIQALEKALRVDRRRKLRLQKYLTLNKPEVPEKKIDIHELIEKLHGKLMGLFKGKAKVFFSEILPSANKEDKVLTFIPMLYLYNQKKIYLDQPEHFGDIHIEEYKFGPIE